MAHVRHPAFLYLITFFCGAASLAMELIAGRLLAPFFGQSVVVWAGVISAVLLFMAAGNLIGGRMIDRRGGGYAGFSLMPAFAGVANTALVVPIYQLLKLSFTELSINLPSFIILFLLSLMVFSVPVLLLSVLLPAVTRMLSRGRDDAGAVIGRVYAVNTAGSIFGAVAAALLMIPVLGVVWSIYAINCALGILSLAFFTLGGFWRGHRGAAAVLVLSVTIIALSFIPGRIVTRTLLRAGIVEQFESEYNSVQIYRTGDSMILAVNDPYFVQSVRYLDGAPRRDVWHSYLLAQAMRGGEKTGRVLFLGYGAGTAATLYRKYYPVLDLTGIEIDGAIAAAGKKHLFDESNARVIIGDARSTLYFLNEKFDIIISDVYRFPYLPHHVATLEFFRLVKSKMNHGGVLVCNAGRYGREDSLARHVAFTLGRVFKDVRLLEIGRFNTIIFASDSYHVPAAPAHFKGEMKDLVEYFTGRITVFVPAACDMLLLDDTPGTEYITHLMGIRYLTDEAYR